MTFGRTFASIFLLAALVGAAIGALRQPGLIDVGIALAAAGTLWALTRRLPGARWLAIGVSAILAATAVLRFPAGGAWTLALLFGAVAAAVLLAVGGQLPGTPRRSFVGLGVALAGLLTLGAGFAGGPIGLGGPPGLGGPTELGGQPAGDVAGAGAPQALAAEAPDRIVWTDFGTGLERARAEGRPLLVHFFASWCGYCKKMDADTWADRQVIARSGDVVPVRVNVDAAHQVNGFTGQGLAQRYRVAGTPAQLLIDAGGAVLANAGGYQTPAEFLRWLDSSMPRRNASRPRQLATSGP